MSLEPVKSGQVLAGSSVGTAAERIGPATKRAIRDVYAPDAAGDERLEGLIEQLRELRWPPSGAMNGGGDAHFDE